MPVIVVGADTEAGESILNALYSPDREIRVFVSDPSRVDSYRARGIKVALGDVSDDSHVEGAATRCFSAVLIGTAARDGRERSFAKDERAVLDGWASATANSQVKRVIWVDVEDPPASNAPEEASVALDEDDYAIRVAELDEAHSIE